MNQRHASVYGRYHLSLFGVRILMYMSSLTATRQLFASPGKTLALGLSLVLTWPLSLSAQIVRGQVVDSVLGTPVPAVAVVLLYQTGDEVARTVTDEEGLFLLRAPGAGQYHLRAQSDGYRLSDFPLFDLAADGMLAYRLLVPSVNPPPPTQEQDAASAEILIDQICQGEDVPDLPVMVGVVRDGVTQEPISQADVILTWSSLPSALVGLVTTLEDSQGAVMTGTTGFYSICAMPVESRIDLHAEYRGLTSEFFSLRFDDGGVYMGDTFVAMPSRLFRQDFEILPQEQQTASITGTIRDTAGTRVPNARVQIVGASYTARANLFGEFRLTGLPPGRMRIAAEVMGYEPTRAAVELGLGEALVLPDSALRMKPVATQLAPVTVAAKAPTRRRNLAEFERRRANTTGTFITRTEFMKQGNPTTTTDVLRRMRGIRVRSGTGLFMPWIITSARGVRTANVNTAGVCFPLIFLDRRLIGTTDALVINNVIPIEQIEAIEFYGSIAGMPPEFNRRGAVCGVLVFWTR